MKKILFAVLALVGSLNLFAQFENLTFGTDSTLDVVTWNIEHFPKNGQTTINYVADIVLALDADVVAIQEVTGEQWLNQLLQKLDGWDGYYAYNQYAALCFIYKTDVIENPTLFEIYTSKNRELPRSPLVLEMDFMYEHFVIINNHFKCCGNGYLNISDPWDEETRRFDACNLLDDYISNDQAGEKVIVLGDLNDEITDNSSNNVFQTFIDNPDNYLFTDMGIAEGSSSNWSYPTWPSHLDHMLITNEIFDEYNNNGSDIETIRLDDYFSSWSSYDNNVSDHRPVGIKIKVDATLGVDYNIDANAFDVYPNPIVNKAVFSFNSSDKDAKVEIYNVQQQLVYGFTVEKNMNSFTWNVDGLAAGIYVAKYISDGKVKGIKKIVLL